MRRILLQAIAAAAMLGAGWGVARAQAPAPNFELVVEAPAGATTIKCVRGCTLMWVERGINPNNTPKPQFDFSCSGGNVERCSSFRVGGWVTP